MNIRQLAYSTAWLMLISALFLPKINFIELGGATFIRLDDFLVAIFVFLKISGNFSKVLDLAPKWMVAFFIFIGISLLSSIINGLLFHRIDITQALLYSLRHVEYFIYIYAGIEFAKRGVNIRRLFFWLTWYLVIFIIFQEFGILDSFSAFSTERASGNTAGPFELAVIAAFLLIYFTTEKSGERMGVAVIVAASSLLVLTQSRITIVGTLIVLLHWFVFHSGLYQKKYFYIGIIAIVLGGVLYSSIDIVSSGLATRFTKIINIDIEGLWSALTNLPLINSAGQYFELAYDELLVGLDSFEGDASAFIRFYRWSLLISMIFSSPELLLIGAGPSFASVAVDGNYVRLLAETGIFGLTSYILFIYLACKKFNYVNSMRYYIIILAMTALFIDIFVSSKAMFLFWFWFGYSLSKVEKNGMTA